MKRSALNLIFILAIFICMLDTTVMNVSLPAISQSLNTDLDTLSWALNAYTIIFAALTIPLTRIADKFGKTRFFIVGASLFGIGSLISGLAGHFAILLLGRIIQAVGAATILPLSMVMGVEAASPAARTKTVALLGTTQGFAAAMGPIIGGIVMQSLSWHWIFFINLPLVVVIIVMIAIYQKSLPNNQQPSRIDWLGSLLSIVMLASLTTVLIKGRSWGWTSAGILVLLAVSIASFLLFIWQENRSKAPMVPLALFKDRRFSFASIILIIATLFLVAISVVLPTYFVNIEKFSTLHASLMLAPMTMTIFIVAPIAGLLDGKVNTFWLVIAGLALMAGGYTLYGFTQALTNVWSTSWAGMLVGAGYGLIIGPVTAASTADFEGTLLSASQSVVGVLRQVGVVLAVAIFVSGLTGNLQTAKKQSIQDATDTVQSAALPTQIKPIILAQSLTQIKAEQSGQSQAKSSSISAVNQTVTTIKSKTTANYRLAFQKLYRWALPAILLTMSLILIFNWREFYIIKDS